MADPQNQGQANAVETVEGDTTYANRAPTSHDRGLKWAHDKGTTVDLYIRSKKSGNWVKQTFS